MVDMKRIITQAGSGVGMGNLHVDTHSNSVNFSVIPFDYQGEKIEAIKIIGGDQNHFSHYIYHNSGERLLAISFDAERARVIDWVNTRFPLTDGDDVLLKEMGNSLRLNQFGELKEKIIASGGNDNSTPDSNSSDNNNTNSPPPTPAEIFQKAWNEKDGNSQLKGLIEKYKVTEAEFLHAASDGYLTSDRQIDLDKLEGHFKTAYGDRVVEPKNNNPPPNNNLALAKTNAIQQINNALDQDPKILSSELNKVLAYIRSKRKDKEEESKLNEDIKNAQNKSGEDLKKELEKMEENEGNETYKKKEEEIKKLNEK
ncbi:1113_t:CDS:2, partial [Cetraspora pellucida]